MRLLDDLGQDRAGQVGELDGLEAGPQALGRVQFLGVGRQALDHQPGPLGRQPGLHRAAAVGGQAVPQQGCLLPTKEATQLAKDLDQGIGVVVAGGDMEGQLGPTATDAVAQRGRHRGLLPVERVHQDWRLALGCPAAADIRGQAERGLVEEDQAGSAPLGVCRIRGQSCLT
jgi:hypothetical protein